MRKAFLLVYGTELGDREKVKGFLESMPIIELWRSDLPNSFYLISQQSAKAIAEQLRDLAGTRSRFIVTEIPADSYGWLTPESWYLIQNHAFKPQ